MNDQERQQIIVYVRGLLDGANQISSEEFCQGPTLLYVKFRDHWKVTGWKPRKVVERLQTRPPLQVCGWRHFENEDWLILTGTEKNRFLVSWTILKSGIIKRIRLNIPEVLESLRWALAGALAILDDSSDLRLQLKAATAILQCVTKIIEGSEQPNE